MTCKDQYRGIAVIKDLPILDIFVTVTVQIHSLAVPGHKR